MKVETAREWSVERKRKLTHCGVRNVTVEQMRDDDADISRARANGYFSRVKYASQNCRLQHDDRAGRIFQQAIGERFQCERFVRRPRHIALSE